MRTRVRIRRASGRKQRFGRRFAAVAAAAFGVALAVGLTASPANADPGDVLLAGSNAAATATITGLPDPVCQQAFTGDAANQAKCSSEIDASADAATVATGKELAAARSLVSAQGVRLGDVVANGGTIWTRTWWEAQHGLYYFNWKEQHSGRIYWDGQYVWVDTSYRGYEGYHTCDQGYGIGYSIVVTSCVVYNHRSTDHAAMWDYYQVHVIFKGIPIYASHNMHVNAYPSGSLYFH
jgi:hypothetical protein